MVKLPQKENLGYLDRKVYWFSEKGENSLRKNKNALTF